MQVTALSDNVVTQNADGIHSPRGTSRIHEANWKINNTAEFMNFFFRAIPVD